jgi:hypothetical protein
MLLVSSWRAQRPRDVDEIGRGPEIPQGLAPQRVVQLHVVPHSRVVVLAARTRGAHELVDSSYQR